MCAVLKIGEYYTDIPQFYVKNIQSGDAFRPIVSEQKYLMDYNILYYYNKNTVLEWE